ncbi:RDD family protein [Microbispora amethystogenes]|uniref:Membrane protein n=1 Tax=Microbispora amethystogenes TaxID=1427754 RepID=A0ABQ4F6Z1_9ACTN|nr:RDD family protein [Microbispora amethystogenes]GIH30543.1 membrane protein [Microbispora amethystogenes]
MSEVVTGEAVVVEVRVAQLPSRALAFLIDFVIQWTVLVVAAVLVSNASALTDDALSVALIILFTVLVIVGYPVAFETLTRGRSPGKLALGLRVVSDDGGPERFRQALFRGLAGFLEFWTPLFGAPALITSLLNQRGKRLGDVFAGTIVIGERGPGETPPPEMPPALASWAATLELSGLSGELAATARQYLVRWHQLSPAMREEMGMRVAGQVSARIAPPPPPGVPPYAYLAAVLAERRRREEARLAGIRENRARYGAQRYGPRGHGTHGGNPLVSRRVEVPQAAPGTPRGEAREGSAATSGGFVPPI